MKLVIPVDDQPSWFNRRAFKQKGRTDRYRSAPFLSSLCANAVSLRSTNSASARAPTFKRRTRSALLDPEIPR
jgi:hypothetical protein